MARKREPGRWVGVVCLLALGLIVYTRLTRFDFVWDGHIPLERVTWRPLNMRDVPINIFFFIPLGFGLAGVLTRRQIRDDRPQRPAVGRLVFAAGLSLSVALEMAQLFLPDRVPSVIDIIANTIGAGLGYGLYRAWEAGFGYVLDRHVTRRNLLLGLAFYALGAALLTASLYRGARLVNWDESFPLVVGNEALGKRQWSGRVDLLELTAGRRDSPDFTARYDFAGEAPFADTSGTTAPPLLWREGPATSREGVGVVVGPGEWLATSGGFSDFSAAARRANAFTIRTTVASADASQRGPARIVSVSADAERRNITLGQEKDALILRLRTPASGENGQKPELLVPGVFATTQLQQITVAYEAPMLRVTVGDEQYALSLAPGAAFFPGFSTKTRWPVVMTGDPYRYDKAYGAIVLGLAGLIFGGLGAAGWWARRN